MKKDEKQRKKPREVKPLSTSIIEILSPETVKELRRISKEAAEK